jgi:lipid A 3-O-deacylase
MDTRASRRRPLLRLAGAAALLVSSAASPAASAWTPDSAFVQYGQTEDDARAFTAGLGWDWPQRRMWLGGELGGYWELALSHWSAPGSDGRESAVVTQFGVKPTFRWRPDAGRSRWFVEGAIGFTVMTPVYENHRKRFSTAFNFGDHVAAGYSFGAAREHELAVRFEHFSNGGIRRPNPGENFWQLRYSRRWP